MYVESLAGEESGGGGSVGGWIAVAIFLTMRHFSSTMLEILSPPFSAATLAFSFPLPFFLSLHFCFGPLPSFLLPFAQHMSLIWPSLLQFIQNLVPMAQAVTEIPFVDECSEWELLSLLGNWYKPETFESVFSSMPSDAVFFSS